MPHVRMLRLSRGSFWRGFLSVFGLGLRPPARRRRVSDEDAIAGDWARVGEDIRKAAGQAKEPR